VLNNQTTKYHNVKQLNLNVKVTKCQYLRRTINTALYTSVSQPPGHGPVPGPGINCTRPREA